MTNEEVNVAVAEQIMGATFYRSYYNGVRQVMIVHPQTDPPKETGWEKVEGRQWIGAWTIGHLPNYCEDIAAAWSVHLNICERLFSCRRRYFDALQLAASAKTQMPVMWPDILVVLRLDMPKHICLAALSALDSAVRSVAESEQEKKRERGEGE